MQIGDEKIAFTIFLQFYKITERTQVIANMQFSGRANAR
jgi:hypothetical protein